LRPHCDFTNLSKVVVNTASMNKELITRHVKPIATRNGVTSFNRREMYRHTDVEFVFFLSILFAIRTYFVSNIFSSFLSFLRR